MNVSIVYIFGLCFDGALGNAPYGNSIIIRDFTFCGFLEKRVDLFPRQA